MILESKIIVIEAMGASASSRRGQLALACGAQLRGSCGAAARASFIAVNRREAVIGLPTTA
jgi:hypothetical protein